MVKKLMVNSLNIHIHPKIHSKKYPYKAFLLSFACLIYATLSPTSWGSSLSEQRKEAFLKFSSCQNVVYSNDEFIMTGHGPLPESGLLGSGANDDYENYSSRSVLRESRGKVQIRSLKNPDHNWKLITDSGVVDLFSLGHRLYVLTGTTLEEWDLKSMKRVGVYPSYKLERGRSLKNKEYATGLYYHQGKFAISHGRLGLFLFSLQDRQVVAHHPLKVNEDHHESLAFDITGQGPHAIIGMDNYTLTQDSTLKGAFRGFLIFDLNKERIVHISSPLETGGKAVDIVQNKVVVSFHPPVWTFNLRDVVEKKEVSPLKMNFLLHEKGWGKMKTYFDNEYAYACFLIKQPSGRYHPTPIVKNVEDFL